MSRAVVAHRPVAHARSRPRRALSPWVVFGVLLFAATLAAVLITTNGKVRDPVYANVSISGDALPALPSTGADPAAGTRAPELRGTDFSGRSVAIANDGRAKAIVFLAHWCSHCQNEVPALQTWLASGAAPKDVDLYSVSTLADSNKPNFPPRAWLEREHWSMTVLLDDETSSASTVYGLTGTPFWVFIRADGTVAGRVAGELGVARLAQMLRALTA